MTKFPQQEVVVDAILNGISNAAENFLQWTNARLFLSHGPYNIITIHVAQEIAKINDAPEIFMDATISDILKCSLKDRSAYTSYIEKNQLSQGTFNITLDERFTHKNDNDSISRVIITIKSAVRNPKAEYSNEIERICKMLDRSDGSFIDYGILGFYSDLSCNARKKLVTRMPELISSFNDVVAKFPHLKARFVDNGTKTIKDSGEWIGGCFIIEEK